MMDKYKKINTNYKHLNDLIAKEHYQSAEIFMIENHLENSLVYAQLGYIVAKEIEKLKRNNEIGSNRDIMINQLECTLAEYTSKSGVWLEDVGTKPEDKPKTPNPYDANIKNNNANKKIGSKSAAAA